MPDRAKVAVVTHPGGAHLDAYFTALAQADEVAEVVVGDPDGACEQAARKALGEKLRTFSRDPRGMLRDEKPLMALVTMEAALAPPLIDAALDAGCHVLAEKPSCVRADDFAALASKADGKHLNLMLAFANGTNPPILEARRIVQSGEIGKVFGLEMHLIADQTRLTAPSYRRNWFAHKERAGGGHLIWLGIHWLDLANYLTGSRPREVCGFAANVGGQPLDVEDSSALALRFENGTLGTLTSGYYLDKGYHSHVKIWGSHGWLHLQHKDPVPVTWYSTKSPTPQVQTYKGPTEPSGYSPFVRAAVRACLGQAEAPVSAAEGLHVLRTVFALYRAAETGATQRVG